MKAFLIWLLARLSNQCGQIPDETGNGDLETSANEDESATTTGEGDDEEAAATGEKAQPEAEASFFDPKQIDTLPIDESVKAQLRQTHKALHSRYNQWHQTVKQPLEQKAQMVDRFYNDQGFARQLMVEYAAKNGLQILPIGQQSNGQQPQLQQRTNGGPPPEVVDRVKNALPPELQWMAEPLAAAGLASSEHSMKPFQERDQQFLQAQQQQKQAQIDQSYEDAAAELREKAPDWEQKENDLTQLWDFLTSSNMKHQKFGNKLELLWNMLNGNATATAEATKRMTSAVRNRSSSSMGSTRTVNNLQDRIRQAPNSRQAFRMAAEAAADKFGGD